MYAAAYRNTEQGMRDRNVVSIEEAQRRRERQRQREEYEAELERALRLAEHRRTVAERAAAMAAELSARGVRYRTTYSQIERRACKLFGYSKSEIAAGSRGGKRLVLARQFIMYWALRTTPLSSPQIGRLMGNRDHTTILAGRTAYVAKRAKMGRKLRQHSTDRET